MQNPDMEEVARLLKAESDRNGGTLPELYRIAWDAYLLALVGTLDSFSHVDCENVQDYFPSFKDDPDANDPVNAMALGKHYFDPDPNIPPGECIFETEFEGLYRKIGQDTRHLGGQLTPGFTVAWSGKLLALHQCNVITDSEYEQLSSMLPVLEDNPVKDVEAVTRRYMSS